MKTIGITSTTILSLLLVMAPAYAQQQGQVEKQDHPDHRAQQQSKQEQTKPQQQQAQFPQQQGDWQQQQQTTWQQYRAQNWQSEHRSWQQRGGYNGYRVPDDSYGSYHGADHFFRVSSLPFRLEGGYPSFQYSGDWFSIVDPYPEYWGDTWYQTDDVYVAYSNDGYYLYNSRYPNSPGARGLQLASRLRYVANGAICAVLTRIANRQGRSGVTNLSTLCEQTKNLGWS